MNAENHPVGAGDVDFKFRSVANSGAFFCYLELFMDATNMFVCAVATDNDRPGVELSLFSEDGGVITRRVDAQYAKEIACLIIAAAQRTLAPQSEPLVLEP